MFMQYLKDKLRQEVQQEIRQELQREVQQEIRQESLSESLRVFLEARFGKKSLKSLQNRIKKITDAEKLKTLIGVAAKAASPQEVLNFIEAEKLS